MEKRDEQRKRDWPAMEPGGGPDLPGGDAEPSNWPGEARERGMQAPDDEPTLPWDRDASRERSHEP